MVNRDFMVCVDRIISYESNTEERECITTSTYHPPTSTAAAAVAVAVEKSSSSVVVNYDDDNHTEEGCCSQNAVLLRECRICQEEDDVPSLEVPCACNGTLKYAHRICIQKWCNKKGDIICEICNQAFSPNYSAPPPRPNPDVMAIDIRQAWGHHFGFSNHHLLALAEAERQLLESEYDEYAVSNAGSIKCLRTIAIILMFLLLIHQILMITRDLGLIQGYSTFFHVSFLQLAGFLLPCYVLARSWYILYTRRRRQG